MTFPLAVSGIGGIADTWMVALLSSVLAVFTFRLSMTAINFCRLVVQHALANVLVLKKTGELAIPRRFFFITSFSLHLPFPFTSQVPIPRSYHHRWSAGNGHCSSTVKTSHSADVENMLLLLSGDVERNPGWFFYATSVVTALWATVITLCSLVITVHEASGNPLLLTTTVVPLAGQIVASSTPQIVSAFGFYGTQFFSLYVIDRAIEYKAKYSDFLASSYF